MLDPNEAAFLRSIAEAGADDTPRLVFADWLDDRGDDARAEFVRLQCELAAGGAPDDRRQALRVRERALLDEHRAEWVGALGLPVEDVRFERGLVAGLRLPDWVGGRLLDPAVSTGLVTLTELDLSGLGLGDAGVSDLAAARLPALRKLILSDNAITAAGVAALAAATGMPRLDTLYLFGNPGAAVAPAVFGRSSHSTLTTLDIGERPEGYCRTPGETDVARRRFVREHILPLVTRYFATYEKLQSAALCVAQYWDDEADDAVHGTVLVSELPEPTLKGVSYGYDESEADANLPTIRVKPPGGDGSSSRVSLWETNIPWDDNSGAIPLWAAFAPEGGDQNLGLAENYAAAVLFYRDGGYEFLPMERPQLDGIRPEDGVDD